MKEERDKPRIQAIFSDIVFELRRVKYHLRPGYPGLTRKERDHMRSVRKQVSRLIVRTRKVGKL